MVFLIISIFVGLLLAGIGFLLNERNAPSMISGYNSLTEEEKKQVLLNDYVKFFRGFHFTIGSLIIVFSLIFYFLKLIDYIGLTMLVFSLPGYSFFIFKSQYYYPPQKRKPFIISFYVLIITTVAIGVLLLFSYQNAEVKIFDNQIEITGIYGVKIHLNDIESQSLSANPPRIKQKTNGFAMSTLKKGWFKLEDGRKAKLLIENMSGPFLTIKTKSNEEIILSLNSLDEVLLHQQLKLINLSSIIKK